MTSQLAALVEKLEQLERAATITPWNVWLDTSVVGPIPAYDEEGYEGVAETLDNYNGGNNAQLIAKTRNALPTLLACIKEMHGALEFYATKPGESAWEESEFLTFDKFGGLCEETNGPKIAQATLAKCDQLAAEGGHEYIEES